VQVGSTHLVLKPGPGDPPLPPKPPKPGDPKPGDPKPGDPKPGDPNTGGNKPGKPKPGKPQAGEPEPGWNNTGGKAPQAGRKQAKPPKRRKSVQVGAASKAERSEPPKRTAGKTRAKSYSAAGGKSKVAGAMPDLRTVKARRSSRSPSVIEFQVENAGRAAAAKSVATLVCSRVGGGAEMWTTSVPATAAGERQWVRSAPARPRMVRTQLSGCRISVDSANGIAESNERNNAFACAAECAPTIRARKR